MSSRSQRRKWLIQRFQSLSYPEKRHFRDQLMETTHVMHSIPLQDIPDIVEGKQKPRLFQTDLLHLESSFSDLEKKHKQNEQKQRSLAKFDQRQPSLKSKQSRRSGSPHYSICRSLSNDHDG